MHLTKPLFSRLLLLKTFRVLIKQKYAIYSHNAKNLLLKNNDSFFCFFVFFFFLFFLTIKQKYATSTSFVHFCMQTDEDNEFCSFCLC